MGRQPASSRKSRGGIRSSAVNTKVCTRGKSNAKRRGTTLQVIRLLQAVLLLLARGGVLVRSTRAPPSPRPISGSPPKPWSSSAPPPMSALVCFGADSCLLLEPLVIGVAASDARARSVAVGSCAGAADAGASSGAPVPVDRHTVELWTNLASLSSPAVADALLRAPLGRGRGGDGLGGAHGGAHALAAWHAETAFWARPPESLGNGSSAEVPVSSECRVVTIPVAIGAIAAATAAAAPPRRCRPMKQLAPRIYQATKSALPPTRPPSAFLSRPIRVHCAPRLARGRKRCAVERRLRRQRRRHGV